MDHRSNMWTNRPDCECGSCRKADAEYHAKRGECRHGVKYGEKCIGCFRDRLYGLEPMPLTEGK